MIHHQPRQIRPTPRTDFTFPRAVFRVLQWVVLIGGTIAATISSVGGAVSAASGGGGSAAAAFITFLAIALYTVLSYAGLAGILALFQIADDLRDQLELHLQQDGQAD